MTITMLGDKSSTSTTSSLPFRWISIFETNSRFYIVGSDHEDKYHSVIKIERTGTPNNELYITDGGQRYTRSELNSLLSTLNEIGVQTLAQSKQAAAAAAEGKKSKPTGNVQSNVISERIRRAYGLLGFVRFLQGYYLLVVTKATQVAQIGYHSICKMEETCMIYIPSLPTAHVDELKYLKVFQSVDLSTNFYFSYTYDLSRTLQENVLGKSAGFDPRFVWNEYLMQPMLSSLTQAHQWLMPIVHGYVGEGLMCLPAARLSLLLLARRSSRFSGTRFLKRGSNLNGLMIAGDVANDVESEQIVWDRCAPASFHNGRFTSFVQRRGSVPFRWSQDPSNRAVMSGKPPPIQLNLKDPFAQLAAAHLRDLRTKYGSPLSIVNLIKRREKRQHESILHENFLGAVDYLNQFLSPSESVLYLSFDVARCHKMDNAMPKLESIGYNVLAAHGWFQSFPPLYAHQVRTSARMQDVQVQEDNGRLLQHGLPRTNCVDCLDRTNVAQFVISKVALSYQLYSLGLLPDPELSLQTAACRLLEMLFEDHGDTLALQYAGSQLVHSIKTYKKIAVFQERSRDVIQTLSRYYSNTFSDFDKQMAINLFLGVYQPGDKQPALWELHSDEYLHNKQHLTDVDYCAWYLDNDENEGHNTQTRSVEQVHTDREAHYHIHYKTHELSSFDHLLLPSQARCVSVHNLGAESSAGQPFASFWKSNNQPTENSSRKNVSGSEHQSSSASGGQQSQDSSSDEEAEAQRDVIHIEYNDSWTLANMESSKQRARAGSSEEQTVNEGLRTGLLSMRQAYDWELKPPSQSDMHKYSMYVRLGAGNMNTMHCNDTGTDHTTRLHTLDDELSYAELRPQSMYTWDSAFSVDEPVVSDRARRMYEQHVNSNLLLPNVPNNNRTLYQRYVRNRQTLVTI